MDNDKKHRESMSLLYDLLSKSDYEYLNRYYTRKDRFFACIGPYIFGTIIISLITASIILTSTGHQIGLFIIGFFLLLLLVV